MILMEMPTARWSMANLDDLLDRSRFKYSVEPLGSHGVNWNYIFNTGEEALRAYELIKDYFKNPNVHRTSLSGLHSKHSDENLVLWIGF